MLNDLWYRLRALFRRGTMETELDEELRAHLEYQADKNVRSGLSRDEQLRAEDDNVRKSLAYARETLGMG